MLGFSTLSGSNAAPHTTFTNCACITSRRENGRSKDRFGNHTDAIFKRHNMKSIGYWSPEDAPSSQNLFIYILEHPQPSGGGKELGRFFNRIRNGRR